MTKKLNKNPYELPQWERPDNYLGYSPDGDFIVCTRTRDSSLLGNTNFDCIEAELQELDEQLISQLQAGSLKLRGGKEDDLESFIYTHCANHWACGWVEHLMLRFHSPEKLQARVYEIHAALSDYPVYDESAYSEALTEAMSDYWDRMCLDRRIELCAEHEVSIFAARRGFIPERLYEQVRAWVEE